MPAQQQDFWAEAGTQQAGREHTGRQSRDTHEAGRQQLGWQEEAGAQQEETGTQQAGLHTGRQMRDTQEEGLQQDEGHGVGRQHEGAGQRVAPEQTGPQHTGLRLSSAIYCLRGFGISTWPLQAQLPYAALCSSEADQTRQGHRGRSHRVSTPFFHKACFVFLHKGILIFCLQNVLSNLAILPVLSNGPKCQGLKLYPFIV